MTDRMTWGEFKYKVENALLSVCLDRKSIDSCEVDYIDVDGYFAKSNWKFVAERGPDGMVPFQVIAFRVDGT